MNFKANQILICLGLFCLLMMPYRLSWGFVVENIRYKGFNRISVSSVKNEIPIEKGMDLTSDKSNEIISDLYQTGYFNNIKLYRSGSTLIIQVKERPVISTINISGNNEIETKNLKKVLKSSGLTSGNIFNPTVLERVKRSLEKQYFNLGKYSVKVQTLIKKLARNRVKININIAEGQTAKIKRIDLTGDTIYAESTLLDQLTLTTPSLWNLWGLINNNDQYSQQRMRASVENLKSYYMDRGYIDFKVDSSQVSLNPAKDQTYITINLTEGDKYKISQIAVEGNTILSHAKIKDLISIQKGDTFSRKQLLSSADRIKSALGDKGYAFAQVNPVPNINHEKQKVALTFQVSPGKKVYINEINFNGNTVTNDYVFRREMLVMEGSRYRSDYLKQSKRRIQRLPYVDKIKLKKEPVPNTSDKINLNYAIKERSANSVSANLGFSQLYSFIVGAQLKMPNIFGTGNKISLDTQLSAAFKTLSFSYKDPYITDSGISQNISAHISQTDTSGTTLASFSTNSAGLNVGYGIPFTINSSFNIGGGVEFTSLDSSCRFNSSPNQFCSETVNAFIDKQDGKTQYNAILLDIGWKYDNTNRAFFPTKGNKLDIGLETALPGSSLTWYKFNAMDEWYYGLTDYVTLKLKGEFGFGDGYASTEDLPFFRNFYGGGWGSVRGYRQGTLGPEDTLKEDSTGNTKEGDTIGGNINVLGSVTLLFPVPGFSEKNNMRLGAFADMGNIYNTATDDSTFASGTTDSDFPDLSNLRYSIGLEFQWLSPMGPLGFSVAQAINDQSQDQVQIFQFSLGRRF